MPALRPLVAKIIDAELLLAAHVLCNGTSKRRCLPTRISLYERLLHGRCMLAGHQQLQTAPDGPKSAGSILKMGTYARATPTAYRAAIVRPVNGVMRCAWMQGRQVDSATWRIDPPS
jgi:hypothetical protein